MTLHERSHNCTHRANFSLTCDAFDRLLDRSLGRCEICGIDRAEAKARRWYMGMDHDRNAGWFFIRGLLCQRCNVDMQWVDRKERQPDPATINYLDHPFWRELTMDDFTKRGANIVASALYWVWTDHRGPMDFGDWISTHDVLAPGDTLEQVIGRLYDEPPVLLAAATSGRRRP